MFQCKGVAAEMLPDPGDLVGVVDDLTFALRDDDTLWTVSAWTFGMAGPAATGRAKAARLAMHEEPSSVYGRPDLIGREPGARFSVKYKHVDYVASFAATNGLDGVTVQQQDASIAGAQAVRR